MIRRRLLAAAAMLILLPTAQAMAQNRQPADTLDARLFAGLWTGDGTGVTLGGGVGGHPFRDWKHEVQANIAYQHVEDSDGFGIDLDYLYNFLHTDASGFTPYAGAGIKVDHFGETGSHLQLGGGLRKRVTRGRYFFGELWFVLSDFNPIILRAGVGW